VTKGETRTIQRHGQQCK